MNIEITVNEAVGLMRGLAEKGAGATPAGWVSHPVADTSKQPPSVMTTATTSCGADMDIDKRDEWAAGGLDPLDPLDPAGGYARAESVAAFIIRNLLDFEAWLDERLFNDEDATVERVRFHADVDYDGRSITMRHLTEYRNADRCKVPREDGSVWKRDLPDDESLEDYEVEAVGACINWVCNELGIEVGEYLDRDGAISNAEHEAGPSEHHEQGWDITEEAMAAAADPDAAYVWGIVNGRLSALERWVKSKVGKGGISAFVTVFGNTVKVRIDDLADMGRGPLMVKETEVKSGHDKYTCAQRILDKAYNVVFGTYEELSCSDFIDSISVATDGM